MLVQHGVDNVDEGFVAVEEPVATGEQVSLEPSLALVLGEHLDNPSARSEMVVVGEDFGFPGTIGHFEDVLKPVRDRFVRTEYPEVCGVGNYDIAQPTAEHPGGLVQLGSWPRNCDAIAREVGELQVHQQGTAVGMRVSTHPPVADRDEIVDLVLLDGLVG